MLGVVPDAVAMRMDDAGRMKSGSRPLIASASAAAMRPDRGPSLFSRLALAGALWSVLFAVFHFYWAAGGRIGTGDAGAISHRPLFFAYDLSAGIVFLASAAVATLLASGRGSARLRSRLITVTLYGAILALVRGIGGLVQDAIAIGIGRSPDVGVFFDLWFAVAGVVFLVCARGLRRRDGVR